MCPDDENEKFVIIDKNRQDRNAHQSRKTHLAQPIFRPAMWQLKIIICNHRSHFWDRDPSYEELLLGESCIALFTQSNAETKIS